MAEEKQTTDEVLEESVEENLDDVEETQAAEDAQEKEARDVTESEDTSEGSQADGTEEAEDAQTPEKAAESKKKEGPFKKKKDKRDEQIEELNDRLKRQMAEFENFRKRTEKEKSQMFDMGARTIVEKILPVVDNFERGLAAVPEEQKEDAFVSGMDKVYKQLMTELETIGVTPIECVGQEFNPDYHNAVMQVENEELEAGTVAQELLKGYMYKDTVVRHSMVSVVS